MPLFFLDYFLVACLYESTWYDEVLILYFDFVVILTIESIWEKYSAFGTSQISHLNPEIGLGHEQDHLERVLRWTQAAMVGIVKYGLELTPEPFDKTSIPIPLSKADTLVIVVIRHLAGSGVCSPAVYDNSRSGFDESTQ